MMVIIMIILLRIDDKIMCNWKRIIYCWVWVAFRFRASSELLSTLSTCASSSCGWIVVAEWNHCNGWLAWSGLAENQQWRQHKIIITQPWYRHLWPIITGFGRPDGNNCCLAKSFSNDPEEKERPCQGTTNPLPACLSYSVEKWELPTAIQKWLLLLQKHFSFFGMCVFVLFWADELILGVLINLGMETV